MPRKPTKRLGKASGGLVQAVVVPTPTWRERLDANRPGRFAWDPTMNRDPGEMSRDANQIYNMTPGPSVIGLAKGGKINRVAGKPIGRDDGMIPAKRGEYVVKKSSTTKYGSTKMNAVNRGTAKVTVRKSVKKRGK